MFRVTCWTYGLHLGICVLSLIATSTLVMAQSTVSQRVNSTAFRVDTDIFYNVNNPKADKQTLTLFKEGVYYDFPLDDRTQSITMLDPLGGRIIMLSPLRQLKTELATQQLQANIGQIETELAQKKELANILLTADKVAFNAQTNTLRVGDDAFAYEATLRPMTDGSIVEQFADFADWSARLNTIMPPPFPPFARIRLNREIASRQALPDTITRTMKHNGQVQVVKSRLLVNAALSKDDEARIRAVGEMLQTCKSVPQSEFFAPPQAAQAPTTPGSRTR